MLLTNFKLIHPEARIPLRATPQSAGADVFSVEEVTIPPRERRLVDLGFSMSFEGPLYARIAPRSGLAVKYSIDVGAGVIDADYRGAVKVLLINNGTEPFKVNIGDRIAQMIFERIEYTSFFACQTKETLEKTVRGSGGFGSTGGFEEQASRLNTY
jgi:deoxyuridine 5'-triphosphate nucleotidohydrolase